MEAKTEAAETVPAGWVMVEALEDGLILSPSKPRGKKGDRDILPRDIALHLGERVKIVAEGGQ